MIVLYWMTPDPVVATEPMSLLEVRNLMVENGIRRLPVTRKPEGLVGIIGRSDLYRWVRPDQLFAKLDRATEIELSRILVADAMTPDPLTCSAYDHIEDVCGRMALDKMGAYPVLNRGALVGVISESDLMRAVSELAHKGREGKRITVKLSLGEEDVLYRIVDLSRRSQLKIHSVLTHSILDQSALMATLRVEGERVDRFVKALWEADYKVIDISE